MEKQIMKCTQLDSLQEFSFERTPVFAGSVHMRDLIALKPVVENLGLNWSGQLQKIERDPKLHQLCVSAPIISSDGRMREMKCLPPMEFQNWLFSINITENLNTALLDEYKKGLVVYLLMMLQISMDEVIRLRNIERMYDEVNQKVERYFRNDTAGKNHYAEGKAIFKENKDLKEEILDMFRRNPDQLSLEF